MKLRVIALAAAAALVAGVLSWFVTPLVIPVGQPPEDAVTGRAEVGGPFELAAHTGETVTDRDFRGKHLLIFFGYTYCPDVCPTTLQQVSLALDELGALADAVQPLFISVDPERDTAESLADYVAAFHPRIVGLTGTPEQIAKAAEAYRAYYKKAGETEEGDEDYLMDHTAFLYLMGPEGEFIEVYDHHTPAADIAQALRASLEAGA